MMYSQNDETGVLEVLEIKCFAAQPWWADLYNCFLNSFCRFLTIWWWHICNYLENEKTKKSLNICFYRHQVSSKPLRGNNKM